MTMLRVSDQDYLLSQQYRDASMLDARIRLHRRFSTNTYGWQRWVFDHLDLPPNARVLELGCGPADLWRENLDRVPADWEITLLDLSPGMIEQARSNLADSHRSFVYEVADAQELPFEDASFDAVVANHMLYHVPDRPKALAEVRRVLRPGGRFYATTNGAAHMRELVQLVGQCVPDFANAAAGYEGFSLENGTGQLAPWFANIERHDYVDGLIVTEARPLIAYVLSMGAWGEINQDDPRFRRFVALVERQLAEQGAIRIAKSIGLFTAQRPRAQPTGQ